MSGMIKELKLILHNFSSNRGLDYITLTPIVQPFPNAPETKINTKASFSVYLIVYLKKSSKIKQF